MGEAAAYGNAHHADRVAIVVESAKLDENLVARMTRITFGDDLRPAEIQPRIDLAPKIRRDCEAA